MMNRKMQSISESNVMNEKCSCEGCELRELFFSNVKQNEIELLCTKKVEKTFQTGEIIIHQGDDIKDFIYLKSGLVKLFKTNEDGSEQIINIAKPFDFVSLLSIFSDNKYQYSVKAIEDSVTCDLSFDMIKNLAKENGRFASDLIEKISKITDKIILQSLEIRRKNLKGRVAFILLYFAKQIYDQKGFELPVSRKEIAEYINMSTENVIRSLSEFRKDNIIRIFGKRIEIIDMHSLERISKFG